MSASPERLFWRVAADRAEALVVGERVRLDERRRIVRLPRAFDVLEVAAVAAEHRQVLRALRHREFEAVVDEPVPLVVGDEIDQVLRLVDHAAERAVGVDAVDLDLRRTILVVAVHPAHVDRHLSGELPLIADQPLVDVGLMTLRIDAAIARHARARRLRRSPSRACRRDRCRCIRCSPPPPCRRCRGRWSSECRRRGPRCRAGCWCDPRSARR